MPSIIGNWFSRSFVCFCFTALTSCRCSGSEGSAFVKEVRAFELNSSYENQIATFTKEPHPFGSSAQGELAKFIIDQLQKMKLPFTVQTFSSPTPNPKVSVGYEGPRPLTIEKSGQNIIAKFFQGGKPCAILLGSHYDTKNLPFAYVGANDSGSSSVLLLQMADFLSRTKGLSLNCSIYGIWFDGEEATLSDWSSGLRDHPAKIQDNTYGSRHFVDRLTPCGPAKCFHFEKQNEEIKALILLDMIGMPELKITQELNSSPSLRKLLLSSAAQLSYQSHINPKQTRIEDDHMPFIRNDIPAINIIDFSNTHTWHKPGDTASSLSKKSISIAGRISLLMAFELAK